MKTIIFLGPPGSGKGSLANWLVQRYGFIHLSTGQIFRSLSNNTSELAQKVRNVITRGEFVSDDLTNQIVKEELTKIFKENQDGCLVLDGYPRTLNQAQFLDQNFVVDKVILLDCPLKEVLFRLSNRLICKAKDHSFHKISLPPKFPNICDFDGSALYQRKDDRREVIIKRYQIYEQEIQPLINFYDNKNLLLRINSAVKLEKLVDSLIKILKLG